MYFFNDINHVYNSLSEHCTNISCPIMSAGKKYEFLWADGKTIKTPIKCSAPEYINYLMNWIKSFFDDESFVPSQGL